MRYVVLPKARSDLDDIWDYTTDRWSAEQAERYIRLIHSAVDTVAADPTRGRPCDEIRPGYRKYPVGSHMIFFRIRRDQVEIVRILHQRMDFDRHL